MATVTRQKQRVCHAFKDQKVPAVDFISGKYQAEGTATAMGLFARSRRLTWVMAYVVEVAGVVEEIGAPTAGSEGALL